MVLGLAVFGTIDLLSTGGAGGGQGPTPLAKPAGRGERAAGPGDRAAVAVDLPLPRLRRRRDDRRSRCPVGREVEFHVTSLDVAHSFWAYELGVKADAIPGSDNVAYVKALQHRHASRSAAPSCAASGTAT